MSRMWHFYDLATGLFSGRSFSASDEAWLKDNLPDGHGVYEAARIDHLSQRVNLISGEVVDYQPPQPSHDHEWNESAKRWQLSKTAVARIEALQRIQMLEAKQLRALREFALGYDGAKQRLQALDDEMAVLRRDVSEQKAPG